MAEFKTPKNFSHLLSISSIDGRFRGNVEHLSQYFCDYAVFKGRVMIEIEYLISFLETIKQPLNKNKQLKLRQIYLDFNLQDAEFIWKKDEEINHDTKAVEYFLSNKLNSLKMENLINFIHFGLSSTDIDNVALTLSLNNFLQEIFFQTLNDLVKVLTKLAKEQKKLVMPARTHGQIAVPTTAGKEIANFVSRLKIQLRIIKKIKLGSKINGAVGNYNALITAYPAIDWPNFSKKFLKKLGLESYALTTQVEPYDYKIELFQAIKRINSIIIALSEDIWRYLALGYLTLRDSKNHIGSSTMPQKINPIGLELAESYANLANAILSVMEQKLPLNRWQRDLTDKYLLRDLGQALAMSYLAYKSITEIFGLIVFNKGVINQELENHWEMIAEGVQTILRTTKYKKPYEKLKELTRGKKFTKKDYEKFIKDIDVPEQIKKKLERLTPQTYIGLAAKF